jgi:hypothetical protein
MECDFPKFVMKKCCEKNEKKELVLHYEKIMSIAISLSYSLSLSPPSYEQEKTLLHPILREHLRRVI